MTVKNTNRPLEPVAKLFFLCMFACLFLDFYELWARAHSIEALKAISCSVQPYLIFSYPLVSTAINNYISNSCAADVIVEPLFSIIFFIIKINISILIFLPFWLYAIYTRKNPAQSTIKKIRDQLDEKGIIAYLKTSMGVSIGILCFVFFLAMHLTMNRTPAQYYSYIHFAKYYEDVIVALLFICVATVTFTISNVIHYRRAKRTKKDDPKRA